MHLSLGAVKALIRNETPKYSCTEWGVAENYTFRTEQPLHLFYEIKCNLILAGWVTMQCYDKWHNDSKFTEGFFFCAPTTSTGQFTAPRRRVPLYLATEHNCSPISFELFQKVHTPGWHSAMTSIQSRMILVKMSVLWGHNRNLKNIKKQELLCKCVRNSWITTPSFHFSDTLQCHKMLRKTNELWWYFVPILSWLTV